MYRYSASEYPNSLVETIGPWCGVLLNMRKRRRLHNCPTRTQSFALRVLISLDAHGSNRSIYVSIQKLLCSIVSRFRCSGGHV